MPGFCVNCGAPLGGAFCGQCGQSAQSAPSPSTQPTAAQPAVSAVPHLPAQPLVPRKASGASKLFMIAGSIVVILCLALFAAAYLGGRWVRQKVSSLTGGVIGGSGQVDVSAGNACKLLSTTDLSRVLGVAVERSSEIMEGNDPGCAYFTNPTAFADLQKIAVEQARRDSEKASKDPERNKSNPNNPLELLKHTEEMEGIVKGLGLTQPDKDGRVFAFTVQRKFGSRNWASLRVALSAVPGFKEIDGVGDHAMMGSFGHAFYVLKGDSMFTLDTMYVPETRVRGAELGRKLISNL